MQLGASADVSRFPRDGDTPAALLRVADEAMLAIKRSRPRPGRSTHPMRPVAQAPA